MEIYNYNNLENGDILLEKVIININIILLRIKNLVIKY